MPTAYLPPIASEPYLDATLRSFILWEAKNQMRRFPSMDVGDLVQECMFCYLKCRNRYVGKKRPGFRTIPRKPDDEGRLQFRALVRLAVSNHMIKLAERRNHDLAATAVAISDLEERDLPLQYEEASASVLIASAPAEIKKLLAFLVDEALDAIPYRRYGRRRKGRLVVPRETTNELYCRVLKLPRGMDIVGMVEQHFAAA